jgi:hypothetical protein
MGTGASPKSLLRLVFTGLAGPAGRTGRFPGDPEIHGFAARLSQIEAFGRKAAL